MYRTSEREIGSFRVGNSLIVTDPCYDYSEMNVLSPAAPGTWTAKTVMSDEGSWGDRVAALIVAHENITYHDYEFMRCHGINVPVDSGQAGFFNAHLYPKDGSTGEYGELDTFYGRACEKTTEGSPAGVIDEGVVSSSGYGDGCYDLYTIERDGRVVAAKIVFIGEAEEDEEEYEVEEEEEYEDN
jgi:hypothetical protein